PIRMPPPADTNTARSVPTGVAARAPAESTPSAAPQPTATPIQYQLPMSPVSLGDAGLQPVDHRQPELRRSCPVHDSMVDSDRDVTQVPADDLTATHNWARSDPADAQDPDLRVVDDRRLEEAAELSRARDREGRAPQLFRLQTPRACCLGESRDVLRDLVDRPRPAFPHNPDPQPF